MPISCFRGDEIPYWEPTYIPNGEVIDFSSGWSFTVTVSRTGHTTLTKSTGITGYPANLIKVIWAPGDLDLAEGVWTAQLTGTRQSDTRQFTIQDALTIKARVLPE